MTYVEPAKYWAFLSYSHRDAKWGAWLHKALESYRPPKQLIGTVTARGPVPKRLAPIFRDREELASATDLGTILNEALRQSACQIVICSPSAARSKWVNEEILAFKRLGREDRIFCLIVGGEPNASDDPAHAGRLEPDTHACPKFLIAEPSRETRDQPRPRFHPGVSRAWNSRSEPTNARSMWTGSGHKSIDSSCTSR